MGERSGDSSGLWSKANRALLPVWATYPLLLLGMWFVLLPFGIALGDPWFFYGFGLCVGTVVALLAGRFYRMTVLEQGDGLWVIRLEFLPMLRRAQARASIGATTEPE